MTTGFIDKAALADLAASFGVSLGETALERFDLYAKLLRDWNEKINLTAITDPGEIVVKHFADSLSVLGAFSPEQGASTNMQSKICRQRSPNSAGVLCVTTVLPFPHFWIFSDNTKTR